MFYRVQTVFDHVLYKIQRFPFTKYSMKSD